MITTLQDSDYKWCPFSRAVYTAGESDVSQRGMELMVTHNRVGGHDDGIDAVLPYAACVGSDCMAWRWFDPKVVDDERRGYCGLAGPILNP